MHFSAIFRQFSWRYYNRNCAFYTQSSILVWLLDLTHQFNVFSENQVRNLRRGFSMSLRDWVYRFLTFTGLLPKICGEIIFSFPIFHSTQTKLHIPESDFNIFLTYSIYIYLGPHSKKSLSLRMVLKEEGEWNVSFKHSKYLQGGHWCWAELN